MTSRPSGLTATGIAIANGAPSGENTVVANVPNYPPLEFKDPKTGTLTGLDIDLGNALAKKLGIEIKWEEISFEQDRKSVV